MPRRTPKLPQAVLTQDESADIRCFEIADFATLEAIVGGSLSSDQRNELQDIARTYLLARAIEANSPTVAAVGNRVEAIKHAAGALRQVLGEDGSNREGFFSAQAINPYLKGRALSRQIGGRVDVGTIALLMRDLEWACDAAARSSLQTQPLSPAWDRLVQDLKAWAKAAGLSTTVSKRLQGKDGALQLSLFARLVKAFQSQFPTKYRQHTQSDGALAKAVSAVRDAKPMNR